MVVRTGAPSPARPPCCIWVPPLSRPARDRGIRVVEVIHRSGVVCGAFDTQYSHVKNGWNFSVSDLGLQSQNVDDFGDIATLEHAFQVTECPTELSERPLTVVKGAPCPQTTDSTSLSTTRRCCKLLPVMARSPLRLRGTFLPVNGQVPRRLLTQQRRCHCQGQQCRFAYHHSSNDQAIALPLQQG